MMKVTSFIIAIALALCFAALSAAYWITELSGQPDWQVYLAVTASVCVSLMAPICAFHMRSHSWLLVVPALIFVGCDIYQNTAGYQTFKSLTVSDEVRAAQTRITQARADIDGITMPERDCWCPETKKADTIQFEARLAVPTAKLVSAQAELKALQQPEAPSTYVAIVMGLIQIALSIFFACMGKRKEKATDMTNVTHFRKPKRMDDSDRKAWIAISKIA